MRMQRDTSRPQDSLYAFNAPVCLLEFVDKQSVQIVETNAFAAHLLERSDLAGLRLSELFSLDASRMLELHLKECLYEKRNNLVEIGLRHRWLQVLLVPCADALGNVHQVLAFLTEITEKKLAEEKLRLNERRLRQAKHLARLGIWEWNVRNDRCEWSDELYQILGVDRDSFIPKGGSLLDLTHPEDRNAQREYLYRCFERNPTRTSDPSKTVLIRPDEGPVTLEFRVIRPDGSERTLLGEAVGLTDENGQPLRLLGTLMDITERKQAELARLDRIAESRRHQGILLSLASDDAVRSGNRKAAFMKIGEVVATGLNVHRAGIWIFNEDHTQLHCENLFEADSKKHSDGMTMEASEFSAYFSALDSERVIDADDAQADNRTRCFAERYLKPLNIGALLNASVRISGQTAGVVSFEHLGKPRSWTADEIGFAGAVGDLIAQVLVNAQRREAIEALQVREEQYRAIFEAVPDAMLLFDLDGQLEASNPAATQLLGYSPQELKLASPRIYIHKPYHVVFNAFLETVRSGRIYHAELRALHKSNQVLDVEIYGRSFNFRGKPHLLATLRDISERKRLENRLLQSQKMEALGVLAGGIAHDFNNILTSVLGYTELATDLAGDNRKVTQALQQVTQAGLRAKDLVRQILTFSRQGNEDQTPLDLRHIVREALRLMRASIPNTISLDTFIESDAIVVRADAAQMHQVVMNLCTNAYQAMPTGGRLSVRLERCELDPEVEASIELNAGTYALLTVTDTGTGIAEEIRSRIFEPFFTTKTKGQGTGLGLSVVHGIVKKHGGHIAVKSVLEQGTSFKIYLPIEKFAAPVRRPITRIIRPGSGRIMLVDDEELLAELCKVILRKAGYEVDAFTKPAEALIAFNRSPETFDALITDLTMPQLTGLELAAAIKKVRPDFPVILATGYGNDEVVEQARALGIALVVNKPYRGGELANALHQVVHNGTENV